MISTLEPFYGYHQTPPLPRRHHKKWLVITAVAALFILPFILPLKKKPARQDETASESLQYDTQACAAIDMDDDTEPEIYDEFPETATQPSPPHTLRRGDIFTCPDTGEKLQVRRVGRKRRRSA